VPSKTGLKIISLKMKARKLTENILRNEEDLVDAGKLRYVRFKKEVIIC